MRQEKVGFVMSGILACWWMALILGRRKLWQPVSTRCSQIQRRRGWSLVDRRP